MAYASCSGSFVPRRDPEPAAPETPGSIHEGGELGYALVHAYGAAYDNPDLLVACVVGDGEAETGPLADELALEQVPEPAHRRRRSSDPAPERVQDRQPDCPGAHTESELADLMRGYGHEPFFITVRAGDDHHEVHARFAELLDEVLDEIEEIQRSARVDGATRRPTLADDRAALAERLDGAGRGRGVRVEGTWRSHQVPMTDVRRNPDHVRVLEDWLRSYGPDELFDEEGRLRPELMELAPRGVRRMSANPHANGGALLRELRLPDFRECPRRSRARSGSGRVDARLGSLPAGCHQRELGQFPALRAGRDRLEQARRRLLRDRRRWQAEPEATDEGPLGGRAVFEMLSEHLCQGWLEGYLLTGRHGLFNCYEAFIHIVDSMFNQHAKWLKVTRGIPWRRPIASLNYLLSSHVWRQDHNGFSHQDPGFIDHVVNKKAEIIRVYLPPDANTLLWVADHCLRSRDYVNVIVAGKQPALQYLAMEDAILHCTRGIGIWDWASNDQDAEPDVVLGCCGDVPTLETLAAAAILRERLPELKVRVVNVVDLMRLQPEVEHPHGLSDKEFDSLFTTDRPIVFAYHGYPWLIHRLTYRRTNHGNLHVRGYKEEGTTTTPFDMVMLNNLDRFHLVMDVIDRLPELRGKRTTCARRCGHATAAPARMVASTARIRRRSATGPGRADRDPRRQRRLDEPEAPRRRRRRR